MSSFALARTTAQASHFKVAAAVASCSNINSASSYNAQHMNLTRAPNLSKRAFSTSLPSRDFHFDTHHFVQRLEREGLNRAQAEGIMRAMAEVIDESVRNMTSNMVTKADQEKVRPRCHNHACLQCLPLIPMHVFF